MELLGPPLPPPPAITYDELYQVSSADDVAQIRALFETAFPIHYGDAFYRGVATGLFAGKRLFTIIARAEGVVLGALCASRELASQPDHEKEATGIVPQGEDCAYLMTLAVREDSRRRGIASGLMDRMLAWSAGEQKCRACYLHVIEYNHSAMDFYCKLGFAYLRTEHGFYPQIEGKDYAARVYVLYLNGGTAPPAPTAVPVQQQQSSGGGVLDAVFDWITSLFGRLFGEPPAEEDSGDKAEAGVLAVAAEARLV